MTDISTEDIIDVTCLVDIVNSVLINHKLKFHRHHILLQIRLHNLPTKHTFIYKRQFLSHLQIFLLLRDRYDISSNIPHMHICLNMIYPSTTSGILLLQIPLTPANVWIIILLSLHNCQALQIYSLLCSQVGLSVDFKQSRLTLLSLLSY